MTTEVEEKTSYMTTEGSDFERMLSGLSGKLDEIDESVKLYKTMYKKMVTEDILEWSKSDIESLTDSISVIVYDIITQNPLLYHDSCFHENIVEEVTDIMMNQVKDLLTVEDTNCKCIKQQFIKQGSTIIVSSENESKQENSKNKKQSNPFICSCINSISEERFDRKKHEMMNLVERVMSLFYRYISPRRSYKTSFIVNSRSKNRLEKISKKIEFLKSIPQAQQRSKEWYDARYNYLTASNVWKAFGTQSSQNQLIYEKCVKKNMESVVQQNTFVSTESPLHWGQKYEPVSLMWYENEYSAKISDFGCIPHKSISFLAASPDGINTCITSSRYGRMIEIKNIVNREITGVPKMEYWIQMQIQMEVCDLNECDFIETKFIEYDGDDYYRKNVSGEADTCEAVDACEADTCEAVAKGVIMFFIQNERPLYEYSKLNITPDEFELWEVEMMEKHKDLTWNRNIYWKLEKVSCVLVLRNKMWFESAYPVLKKLWDTIVKERETDEYLNRAPKKRTKTTSTSLLIDNKEILGNLFSDEFLAENNKEDDEKEKEN